jgi:hypothetical protein
VRKEKALINRFKEERNILHKTQMKANWIGRILRRNYFLKRVIEENTEGRIKVTKLRRRRRKQPLDNLKETRRIL